MELNITSQELAKALKLSTRRVNQLVKESILRRGADGKFNLPEAVDAYYSFKYKSNEKVDYELEHALLEKAKREMAEIELDEHKGKLLYATDVEQAMATMILTCKSRLLSIPSKIAPKVLGQKNLAVIQDVIKTEICQALAELKEMPAPRDEESDAADTELH